jgi:hypothetical protein
MRYLHAFIVFVALIATPLLSWAEDVVQVSMCSLLDNPGAYNHKLIEVTGTISRGFEDFTINDSSCKSRNTVWLEFGGTKGAEVVYCCGPTAISERSQALVLEGIETSIVRDEMLTKFDQLTRKGSQNPAKATIRGRYFSGKKKDLPGGPLWVGYGHMGYATLLAIEQVISVEGN